MQEHLANLNPAQKEAVLHTEGPLLIVAGAGAGKTKTLTERIIHIILGGVSPHNILAITFTNKAASEMRERVEKKVREHRIEGVPDIMTFHRLGGSIIRDNASHLGLTKHFSIIDDGDTRSLIRESMKELGMDPKTVDPKKIRAIISSEKMKGETPSTFTEKVGSSTQEQAARIWRLYEQKKKISKGLDFDDLIVEAVRLLEKNDAIRNHYQKRYLYIHVDEYQDTNEMEYRMVKALAGDQKNICVVGDTDQNIYGWRGAQIRNMLHFEKDFPGAHTVFLEENYRSTPEILKAANAIIEKNTVRLPKNLFTSKKEGEKLSRYEAFDERDEAMFIAKESARLIKEGTKAQDIAVLFRANFQSRVLEEAFILADVPYRVIGTQFFERQEVKDVLSWIRAAFNRDSLADIKRSIGSPKRGFGASSVAKLFSGKRDELSPKAKSTLLGYEKILDEIRETGSRERPSALVRFVLKRTGLEDEYKKEGESGFERIENVGELATTASVYDTLPLEEGVLMFLEDAALRSDQDALKDSPEGVRLLTVHASKGLEFDTVFVTGLEEGLFPHDRASRASKIEDAEEERRLFYVALTRAKRKLYLTHASARTIFGSRNIAVPSEFLYDIPEDTMELHSDIPRSLPSIFFD